MKGMTVNIFSKLLSLRSTGEAKMEMEVPQRVYPNQGDEFLDDKIRIVEQPFTYIHRSDFSRTSRTA